MDEFVHLKEYPGYAITADGTVWSAKRGSWKPLTPRPCGESRPGNLTYLYVALYRNGMRKDRLIHVLMLENLIGPRPDGMQACHNNGNHQDNRIDNLRWDTPRNNVADKILHGTMPRGERGGRAVTTDEVASQIRTDYGPPRGRGKRIAGMPTIADLARKYNLNPNTVASIISERRYDV